MFFAWHVCQMSLSHGGVTMHLSLEDDWIWQKITDFGFLLKKQIQTFRKFKVFVIFHLKRPHLLWFQWRFFHVYVHNNHMPQVLLPITVLKRHFAMNFSTAYAGVLYMVRSPCLPSLGETCLRVSNEISWTAPKWPCKWSSLPPSVIKKNQVCFLSIRVHFWKRFQTQVWRN